MTKPFRVVAVDDEKLATRLIEKFCSDDDRIQLVESFNDSLEALEYLKNNKTDILILDIEMPELNGLGFAKKIGKSTKVIFSTAYENFALEGFNLSATDYLLKPYSVERFKIAIDKAIYLLTLENGSKDQNEKPTHVIVKSNYMKQKIELDNILFIESFDDYITFHLENSEPITVRKTLKTILQELPENNFIRIHRSFVISLKNVESYQRNKVIIAGKELPISTAYKNRFFELIETKTEL